MQASKRHKPEARFLQSISRDLLSFDAEKVCLVTLSNINVYCCLVCGKYLQGRSSSSPAYNHAVEYNHNVFINLSSLKVYLLPDGTPVESDFSTIGQIQGNIDPTYPKDINAHLSAHPEGRTLYSKSYVPGYIPIDTLPHISSALQIVTHADPIRDWFLLHKGSDNTVLTEFSLFMRRLWYHDLFRAHVSPSVFLKCLEPRLAKATTPREVLAILFNVLHSELIKESNKGKSVVSKTFQGKLEVNIRTERGQINNNTATGGTGNDKDIEEKEINNDTEAKKQFQKFWMLPVDFVDSSTVRSDHINERITQVSFNSLLKRYDGQTRTHINENTTKTQQISHLPPYLVFFIDRKLTLRNPTVVKFDLVMDFAPYCLNTVAGSTNYKLVGHIKHKLKPGTKLDSADDTHDWEVLLKRGDEWFLIGESAKPCNGDLLFLEESSVLVWKQEKRDQVEK